MAAPAAYGKVGEVTATPHSPPRAQAPWWHDAVIYQIYPRSWSDSDGDGIGDLPGITARLAHVRGLGADAIWLSPFYLSPMHDGGYDVADHCDVDPLFGTLDDAQRLIEDAHSFGLKVLVDLVPNHTSSDHRWFQAALAAPAGSPERARYHFREGRGPDGALPPNNWRSVFGGEAWSRVTEPDGAPGQWYLHLFDTTQPDVNWGDEGLRREFDAILGFWLDRGVDGFRVDVAHGLVKDEAMPDTTGSMHLTDNPIGHVMPMWDQEGVHAIYRRWRALLDSYTVAGEPDSERILCAEAWVQPQERLARYVRPDEMHQAFNFSFLETAWDAAAYRQVIDASLTSNGAVGAPTTWVLSNHDVVRHASRFGLPDHTDAITGIAAGDPQPDLELGLRRARAATAFMLALPGSAYLYYGEELGLPEHTSLPDEVRQDPIHHRTRGTAEAQVGRDGARVPMPWQGGAPSLGFGPGAAPWLPQPTAYAELAVDRQLADADSTLWLYRTLLRVRRDLGLGRGSLRWADLAGDDVLAFSRRVGGTQVLVVTNFGPDPVPLPPGEVLITSGPLTDGRVPPDTTVWIRQEGT